MPADSVGAEKVAEEASDVAKAIGFVAVDCVIVMREGVFEELFPEAVKATEAFRDEAEEFTVCSFLTAHFDDHGW